MLHVPTGNAKLLDNESQALHQDTKPQHEVYHYAV